MKNSIRVMRVNGMHCEHCKKAVERELQSLPGVDSASADLKKKTVTVTTSQAISDDTLTQAVHTAGYEPAGFVDE